MDGIVSTDDVMGGEPRLDGRRISVRQIAEMVIDGDRAPTTVADQLSISPAAVHRALAYYYENPDEMERVRQRHREAIQKAREEGIHKRPDESFSALIERVTDRTGGFETGFGALSDVDFERALDELDGLSVEHHRT